MERVLIDLVLSSSEMPRSILIEVRIRFLAQSAGADQLVCNDRYDFKTVLWDFSAQANMTTGQTDIADAFLRLQCAASSFKESLIKEAQIL